MNTWAPYRIHPIVITAYIVVGRLRATFICDYLHTIFLYACIVTLMFQVYAVNPEIGSPLKLYDLLKSVQDKRPLASAGGSYLRVESRVFVWVCVSLLFVS
jgi:Na+/proline symporter